MHNDIRSPAGQRPGLGLSLFLSFFSDATKINLPKTNKTVHLLYIEIQMSGEIYFAGKNFLINAERVVIEKRRKPVGTETFIFHGQPVCRAPRADDGCGHSLPRGGWKLSRMGPSPGRWVPSGVARRGKSQGICSLAAGGPGERADPQEADTMNLPGYFVTDKCKRKTKSHKHPIHPAFPGSYRHRPPGRRPAHGWGKGLDRPV